MEDNKPNMAKANFNDICRDPKLKEEILAQVKACSKANGLHGFETVRSIYLESEPFSDANGLLTPTFKLKRQQLRDRYQDEISALYATFPAVESKL